MNCAQPGCAGTIVDGYCDVCGLAGAAGLTQGRGGEPGVEHRRVVGERDQGVTPGGACHATILRWPTDTPVR